jgi:hypothetical protein
MAVKTPIKAIFDGNGNATGLAEFTSSDTLPYSAISLAQVQTPTYSANKTIDWTLGNVARITLTGNIVITNNGAYDGQKLLLELKQDATGSRTVSFTSETRFGTDITGITLTTTANKSDKIGLIYNGADGKYDVIAFARGF